MPNRKLFRNRELNSGREKLADTAPVAETQRWQVAVFLKLPDRALSGDMYIHIYIGTKGRKAERPRDTPNASTLPLPSRQDKRVLTWSPRRSPRTRPST